MPVDVSNKLIIMMGPACAAASPVGSMGVGKSVEGPIASTVSCRTSAGCGIAMGSGSEKPGVVWGPIWGSTGVSEVPVWAGAGKASWCVVSTAVVVRFPISTSVVVSALLLELCDCDIFARVVFSFLQLLDGGGPKQNQRRGQDGKQEMRLDQDSAVEANVE